MIRLRPIETQQTFSIIPSGYDLSTATLRLTENGTNIIQNVDFTWDVSSNGNYVLVTLAETGSCKTYTATNSTSETLTWAFETCSGQSVFVNVAPSESLTRDDVSALGGATDEELDVVFVSEVSTVGATLKEDSIYTLEIFTSTDILYRDTVYVTSNQNKNEVFSYTQAYTQHDDGDDEYIVL